MEGTPVGEQSDHDLLIRVDEGLRALQQAIAEKFDALTRALAERERTVDDRHGDHEKRIRTLEQRIYAIPGIGVVIAVASLGVAIYDRINSK